MIKTNLARTPAAKRYASVIGIWATLLAQHASAGDADIKKAIEDLYPTAKVSSISPTSVPGISEVITGQEVIYATTDGKFLFYGPMIQVEGRKNLTAAKKENLLRVDFKSLPLELAVKSVKGDGSRVFASFEDPNCGYCKRLHEGLKKVDNYTMYTFLTPILSEDSKTKAQAIWCSSDRSGALANWMNLGSIPSSPPCAAPIAQVLELSASLGVKGTPTLVFADGKRIPGYIPPDQLERVLTATHKAVAPGSLGK